MGYNLKERMEPPNVSVEPSRGHEWPVPLSPKEGKIQQILLFLLFFALWFLQHSWKALARTRANAVSNMVLISLKTRPFILFHPS